MRKINLCGDHFEVSLNQTRREKYGLCDMNCYQNHTDV